MNQAFTRVVPAAPLPSGEQLWDRVQYRFDNRRVDLDKTAAGITFAQEGNAIRITVASGTPAHATAGDGAWLVWNIRSSLTGRIYNPGFDAGEGNTETLIRALEFLEVDPDDEIDIAIGTSNEDNGLLDYCGLGMSFGLPEIAPVYKHSPHITRWRDASLGAIQDRTVRGSMTDEYVHWVYGQATLVHSGNRMVENQFSTLPSFTPFPEYTFPGNSSVSRFNLFNYNKLVLNVFLNDDTTAERTFLVRPRCLFISPVE